MSPCVLRLLRLKEENEQWRAEKRRKKRISWLPCGLKISNC
jgi:hypothetical protein